MDFSKICKKFYFFSVRYQVYSIQLVLLHSMKFEILDFFLDFSSTSKKVLNFFLCGIKFIEYNQYYCNLFLLFRMFRLKLIKFFLKVSITLYLLVYQ